MPKKQLNVQISDRALTALKAAAYVDDASPAALAAPLIEKYAARRSKEPMVAKAIQVRTKRGS